MLSVQVNSMQNTCTYLKCLSRRSDSENFKSALRMMKSRLGKLHTQLQSANIQPHHDANHDRVLFHINVQKLVAHLLGFKNSSAPNVRWQIGKHIDPLDILEVIVRREITFNDW